MDVFESLVGGALDYSLEATGFQGPPVAEDTLSTDDQLPVKTATEADKAIPNEHCPEHRFPTCPIPSYILKVPPRKAPAPAAEPAPSLAESAVSLEFLRVFLRRIPGGPSGGATMARVVEELIRPSTSATLSSYASQPFLVHRSHVSAPTWVVIHPWDLPVADLVAALEEFAVGLPPTRTYFWLRALAISQHLMGASAALQPLEDIEEELAPAGVPGEEAQQQQEQSDVRGAEFRAMPPAQSFGTMLRKRQMALAVRQKVAVRTARLEALAATRGAVAASRCGVLLLVGRDVRPLRRGWCLVEVAEALRAKGPEAITVLPVDKAFTRADLVRHLRELDVSEAVSEAEEHDKEVLAEVLGVRLPQPPAPPGATDAQTPGTAAASATSISSAATGAGSSTSDSTISTAAARRRTSVADPHSNSHTHSHRQSHTQQHPRSSGSNCRPSCASGSGSRSSSGAMLGPDPGEDDGFSGGRALTRQLQLALLLRPMDGALPARMLGAPLGDANPVATSSAGRNSSAGPTAFATPTAVTAAAAAMSRGSKSIVAAGSTSSPCGFDWLWDWTPMNAWLALPSDHPNWQALLITGTHGSGKTTAMSALLSRLAAATMATSVTRGLVATAPLVACHFCSAADARSLVATEVVRSLAYQLSCRSPGFGAAVCRSLLQLGGPGAGLALTPDGWLQGLDDAVAVLLRKPMEQDAEARVARGDPPANYLLLIDGLDEGPASAASSSVLVDIRTPEDDTGPPACPGPYQVLRLLVDHLRQLPCVRLILSCTEAADAAPDAASGNGKASSNDGSSAVGVAALPRRPFDLPPPVIVAPRVAADASASVHLAVRQVLRPRELPLTVLRRDKHLPLALAHVLQEYVLSPELTARELLWQARGCLTHVHILQLLVKHAAEQLGPAAGLPDDTAIASAATVANASVGIAAPPASGPTDERALAVAATAATAQVDPQAPPQPLPPQLDGEVPPGQQLQQRGHDMPPRPRTPPRQDKAGLVRQQSQRRQSSTAAGLEAEVETGPVGEISEASLAPPLGEFQLPDVSSTAEPSTGLGALRAPNTGDGAVGLHAIPPVCRGSLADEYSVLWHVRTAELLEAARIAIVRDAGKLQSEEEPVPSSPPQRSPRRMDTMTLGLTVLQPPKPPYPPELAARLQLVVDVLAAAQEPLEWSLLVRIVLSAETPGGSTTAPAAVTPVGAAGTPVRTSRAELKSPSPAGGDATAVATAVPGSPRATHIATPRRGSTPLSLRSGIGDGIGPEGGGVGTQQSRASSRSEVDDISRAVSPSPVAAQNPWASREAAAAAAAAALRDLEWALEEGPLAGLVWITACGRVTVRHSSFLDWLRRASTAVSAAAAATGPPTTAASAAVAAAAAVATGGGAAAVAAAEPPLGVPRPQRGHTALARLLRQELLSGRVAAAVAMAPGTPLAVAAATGHRRPGSASNMLRTSLEGAGSAALVALGLVRPPPMLAMPFLGFASGGGSASGALAGGSGSGRSLGPPASVYCLRHVVTHCAEGRLPSSELETTIMDVDFWRQVLEGCHLEMVAASLEHILRTRGPHARRPNTPQQQQQQGILSPGMLPRTPPPAGAVAALVRGAPATATSPRATLSNVSGGAAASAAAAAAAVAAPGRDGRTPAPPPLPAATACLLRDTLLWLLQDGRSLIRRPEPLMLVCSASCTPLQSPFRRLAEHITVIAAVAGAAAAADSLFPLSNKLTIGGLGGMGSTLPTPPGSPPPLTRAGGAAATAVAPEPLFPSSFVTAMPHPRFRLPIMRAAYCPHRVTGLLARHDGEVVLASGECSSEASVMDTLSGRRALLLHVGRDAHHAALSAAAFAPYRALLATAGCSAGSIILWDLTTGAPRATLHMRPPESDVVRDNKGEAVAAGRSSTRGKGPATDEASFVIPLAATAAIMSAESREAAGTAANGDATAFESFAAIPTLASGLMPSGPIFPSISSVYPSVNVSSDQSPRRSVSPAVAGAPANSADASGTIHAFMDHGSSQPSSRLRGSNDPYVTCIAIYEPGPGASATAYGAPSGARIVASSAAAAAAAAEGTGVAIVRGSALVAAGESSSGQVVLWAVAPDGWGATRTGELMPPTVGSVSRGGAGVAWLGFLPGGKSLLVVQSCSTVLRIWSVQSHNITATLRLPAACGEVFGVHIAPQLAADASAIGSGVAETLVAAVCTTSTELWALDSRSQLASLPVGAGGEGGGRAWADACVAFSPAGGLLASAGALCAKPSSTVGSRAVAIRGSTPSMSAAAAATLAKSQPLVVDPCAATLWDARNGAQVIQLLGLRSAVGALAFSPDGALLATALADAAVMLWSAATGACLSVLPLAEDVTDVPAVVFARRGAMLMAAGGSAVYTWDVQLAVAAAAADATIGGGGDVAGGTPISRGRTLLPGGGVANGGNSGNRRGMHSSGEVSGHRDLVAAVCFSPSGVLALTGGDDSTIRLWDVVRHTELVEVEQPGGVMSVAWSPDGTLIAAGLSNGTAHVWYFGAVAAASAAPSTGPAAMGSTANSGAAAAAMAAGDFTAREAARLRCSGNEGDAANDVSTTMNAVSFSADGKLLLTADGEGRVSVWNVVDWQQVGTALPSVKPSRTAILRGSVSSEAEGGKGGGGGGGGSSSTVVSSGTMVGRYAGAAFSSDGRWVLMGCGREVLMWNVMAKRESSERLGPHGAPVVAVAASPCGKLVAVGAGSTVTIWGRPDAGFQAATLGGAAGRTTNTVTFRKKPAEGGGGGPSSPFSARVTVLPALAEVTALAFSADATMLAASLGDGSIRVWDTGRWKEVGWLSAHGAAVTSLAFSPDGLVLLSGGADCRCLAWSTRDVLQPVFGSISGVLAELPAAGAECG